MGEPYPAIGDKLKDALNKGQKDKTDPFVAVLEDSVMSLSNLTLLSSHINESIGRKLFTEKRSIVIRKQTEGYYVPPCTMMVFTKSFTSTKNINAETHSNKFDYWSDIDREEYQENIKSILVNYFGTKPAEETRTVKSPYPSCYVPSFIDIKTEESSVPTTEASGEIMPVMTFSELAKKYDYIVIPKIQRDYAHGRIREEDDGRATQVRTNLLKDIFSVDTKKKIDFQIIFGTEEQRQTDMGSTVKTFIPIDGQQRLTTLFLLTLYRDKRWGNNADSSQKFIYETRRAATDFCVAVANQDWSGFPTTKPSKAIKESVWFMDYWKQDPTVKSMLNMLDDIHLKSPAEETKYPNLENIEFSFFDLGRHNISENIYLKMNSRGKPLTSFENLKAEIERCFAQQLPANWKRNIDTTWLDSFWATSKPTRLPDEGFLRYIANFLFIKMCEKNGFDKNVNEDKIISQLEKINNLSSGKFVSSEPFIKAFEQVGFDDLTQLLSIKSKRGWHDLIAPAWGWKNDDSDWRSVLDSSYARRAVMYAIMLNAAHPTDLKDWLRFAWNIARNTVSNFETFCDCCKLFQKLAKIQYPENGVQPTRTLLEVLCSDGAKGLSANQQYAEERVKAFKHTDVSMYSLVLEMERYAFFEGAIRPLFHQGEEGPWFKFKDKCENIYFLVPIQENKRLCMCQLITYIPDSAITQVFYRDYLSFDNANMRTFFLREDNREYIERYLLQEKVKSTPLTQELMAVAQQLSGHESEYYLRTDWGTDFLLTKGVKRKGYNWILESFVINDPIYNSITDILHHQIPDITFHGTNLYHDIVRGLQVNFKFNHYYFRFNSDQHTIWLMGKNWNGQFLGHQSDAAYTRTLTTNDTSEIVIKMLNDMVSYANEARKDFVDRFVKVFQENSLPYAFYACKDKTDIPISENEPTFFEWLTIAHRPDNSKWLYAVTLSSDLHIEIGLRRVPEDAEKNAEMQNLYQELRLGASYSDRNAWWYGVSDFNYSTINEGIEQLEKLIEKFVSTR